MNSNGDQPVPTPRGVVGVRRWYGWVYTFYLPNFERRFTVWLPFPEPVRGWLSDRWCS